MLKILLVDDERTVLQGLSHILLKYCPNYEIAGMAQSAFEALPILKERQVDVVITDVKMPDMTGIELTQMIRSQYPRIAVIVLSGYADFEFVRQSMKNGACDYLLKPCNYQNVLELLYKIEEELAQQGRVNEHEAKKELLKEVILGKQKLPEMWNEYLNACLTVVKIQGRSHTESEERIYGLLRRANMERDLLDLVPVDDFIVLVFREGTDLSGYMPKFYACRQNLQQAGYVSFWASSGDFAGSQGLKHAYRVCLNMLEFLIFNEIPMVLTPEQYQSYIDKQSAHTISDYFSVQTVGKYLLGAEYQKVKPYIEQFLNDLQNLRLYWEPNRLKNDLLKQLFYLDHYLKDHGIHPCVDEPISYLQEVKNLTTFRELSEWLKRFAETLTSHLSDGEEAVPQYIHSAVSYIEKHYMDDLNLKTVSETVFLNPWYFSAQFKKYLNVNFSEYLNLVRVRMAKHFLKQKDLKVYQVAELVGFQDAAYFSTVFKNIEHMSPKDYQKTVS